MGSKLLIDHRECNSERYQLILDSKIEHDLQMLPVGDYQVENSLLEYKSLEDFMSSLKDRLWWQLENMKANPEINSAVVVVGDPEELDDWDYIRFFGAVARLWAEGMPVHILPDDRTFIKILARWPDKVQNPKKAKTYKVVSRKETLKDEQIAALMGFKGIGSKRAEAILKDFRSPRSFLMAPEDVMIKIRGITRKVAEHIKNVFGGKGK